ncbi:hypothetical protein R6Q59_034756 [Mikania micrantha]
MAKTGRLNQDGFWAGMAKTGRLGQTAWFWAGIAKTGRLGHLYFSVAEMDAEMPHQEDVAQQQGPPLDPESLALSQYEWLQFEPASAVAMRCRCIL